MKLSRRLRSLRCPRFWRHDDRGAVGIWRAALCCTVTTWRRYQHMTIPCSGFTNCLFISYSNVRTYIEAKVLVLWNVTSRDWVICSRHFETSSRLDLFKKTSEISVLEFENITVFRNVRNRIASDTKSYTRWTFQLHCLENFKSLRRLCVLKRTLS
jgi:hypothetical protein